MLPSLKILHVCNAEALLFIRTSALDEPYILDDIYEMEEDDQDRLLDTATSEFFQSLDCVENLALTMRFATDPEEIFQYMPAVKNLTSVAEGTYVVDDLIKCPRASDLETLSVGLCSIKPSEIVDLMVQC